MDKIIENREKLKKQEAWAGKVAKKEHMNEITIEEHCYGSGKREKMDYIYPKDRIKWKKLPIFFYIHGGGWIAGRKESRQIYLGKYAQLGYFVVNIEYDLAPECVFPTQIGQCILAVDTFLDVAENYPVDTEKIAVGGESAGVYYAAFVSAISKRKTILGEIGLPEMKHMEFDVKVNLFNCGAVNFSLMKESGFPDAELMVEAYAGGKNKTQIEPFSYIGKDFPATYLIYGKWDCLKNNTFYMRDFFEKERISYALYKSSGIFYGQHTASIILKNKKAFRILEDAKAYMDQYL